ncbi:hypothetical protein CHUAL_008295 [Chamberlinius hualienensis]
MKSWNESQVFFVFDNEFCQNEEDDPKDAIIYFFPHETSDNVRCTLCCQLMGICRFMASCFAPVSLIRLQKGKFVIKTIDKYTLALKGNNDMPDKVLERQLAALTHLFMFYNKDFDTVFNIVNRNRHEFINYMTSIWSQLLNIAQHGGKNVSLTFDIISHLDMPQSAGLLFLQTSQLLQACQRFSGVYAGCLLCDRRVLFSQLSTSILNKLSFIWLKQRAPGEYLKVLYELPGGITLVKIYLTLNELHELELIRLNGTLSHNLNAEETTGTSTMSVSSSPLTAIESHGSYSASSEVTSLSQTSASATLSYADDSCRNSSSGAQLTNSTDQTSVSNTDDVQSELTQLQQHVLYIQQYNDTTLIIILDENAIKNPKTIYGLWKLCTETIMSLETDVKNCIDNATKKASESELSYFYIQYDKIWQKAQGNGLNTNETDRCSQLFSRCVQLLHEDFICEPQLYEITVKSEDIVVYGHSLGSRETYFCSLHPSAKPSTSSSPLTNCCKPSHGFPLHSDSTATVAAKAKRKLAKEQRLVLL